MKPADLAARAVELAGAHLVTAVARIPGAPGEQLCSLLAERLRLVPGGPAVFAALEGMPTDLRVRRVLVAQLAGLIEEDRQFTEELLRAVRNAGASPSIHNVIDGNFSGPALQSGSINNSKIDMSQRKIRISLGRLILVIALVLGVGVTITIFVTNVVDSDTTSSGTPRNETNGQYLPSQENQAPPPESPTGENPADCGRAERPELTLSPAQGSVDTRVTVSGVGFIPNGRVNIVFHADDMGEATTDCHGAFTVTLPIPQQEFYRHFPNQSFDVRATEWTSSGQYQGNGDFNGARFYLTG